MFIIIILILLVDTVMLGIFAVDCNRSAAEYLIPMYGLQIIGYAALYRIYLKMRSGKREKLEDKLEQLRRENIELREKLGETPKTEQGENMEE